jgi:hypothetical protein
VTNKSRPSETVILRDVEQAIGNRLPPGWSGKVVRAPGRPSNRRRDAFLRLRTADGVVTDVAVEVKRSLDPQQAVRLVDEQEPTGPLVIVAPYLSERTREVIAERGVGYADTTGNVRLLTDSPAMFVMTTGADRDPWPNDQKLKTLRGRGAGRAVRALVDLRPPYGVRELASRADVSPATLARVIDLLAREALLTRDERGGVTDLDWAGCIRRWSKDSGFAASNTVSEFIAPGGLTDTTTKLSSAKWRYAATGSLAAQPRSPVAPTRQAMIYADDIATAARQLDLRETDSGANVLIAEPFDPVVYERTDTVDGLRLVAPSQAACDLLTGSGRMPSEGEELLDWMRSNERAWRP